MTMTDAYQNPLRSIDNLVPERVDQGVDYGGTGPIYAIGDAIIENVIGKGWPGGTFIEYQLTSGPQAGQHVYVAEDVTPNVTVGEHVTPSTVIGTLTGGSSGIETGWANPNVSAQQAAGHSQWAAGGDNANTPSTAFGASFNSFLQSLGAPGGKIVGTPVGTVPANLTNIQTTGISDIPVIGPIIGGVAGDAGTAAVNALFGPFQGVKNAILLGSQAVLGFVFIALGVIVVLVDTGATSKVR